MREGEEIVLKQKYLSIDIGGTYTKFAYIDESGNILSKNRKKSPDSLVNMYTLIDSIITEVKNDIKGVGISCPGKIDSNTGTIYHGGSLPFLNEVSLRYYVEDKYHIPCAVINDGKAAVLSELWLGNLKGIDNGAAIVLGTGIGGGLVLNGKLFEGAHYQAGELSFMISNQNKEDVESLAGFSGSAVGFVEKCAKILGLEDTKDGYGVFEQLNDDHPEAVEVFRQFCREIALVINNVQTVIDLSRVVIGGGICAQSIVTEEIVKQYNEIRKLCPIVEQSLQPIEIVTCKLKSDSNLIGALYQLFLQIEKERYEVA